MTNEEFAEIKARHKIAVLREAMYGCPQTGDYEDARKSLDVLISEIERLRAELKDRPYHDEMGR